jgi:hypothetical protein
LDARAERRRLRAIEALLHELPPEVDIPLNPRIGRDWSG